MKKVVLGLPLLFITVVACIVAVQINWGYHVERGALVAAMAVVEFDSPDGEASTALASEICGEELQYVKYETKKAYKIAMPEHETLRHLFVHEPFREVVWAGIGVEEKYCLARYEVIARDRGRVMRIPVRLFPYPRFVWLDELHIEKRTLLERITRPQFPDGTKALLPGECASKAIAPGQTDSYRTTVPRLGQEVRFQMDEDRHSVGRLAVTVASDDGREIPGILKTDANGGGTYDIVVSNPTAKTKHYRLQVNWSGYSVGCPHPENWRN